MIRILLAGAFLLPLRAFGAVIPPSPDFSLQEPGVRAEADAYATRVCEQTPPLCAEVRQLGDAFKKMLDSATACDQGGCTLDQIKTLARALGALEQGDAVMQKQTGGPLDRAYLSLSVIVTSRLTNAATRLGQPFAGSTYGPDRTQAEKSLAAYCLASPPNCASMRAVMDDGREVEAGIQQCAASKCKLEEADPLAARANGLFSRYFALNRLSTADTLGIFTQVNTANTQGIALYSPLADGAVASLTAGADKLKRDLDLAEKNPSVPMSVIDDAGPALHESHRRAAMGADRLAYFLGYADGKNGAEKRREAVNTAAIKLASLRARALALRAARGLGELKAGPGDSRAATGGAAGAAGPQVMPGHGLIMTESPRTFLDRRLVPSPAGSKAEAPPILPGSPNRAQLLIRGMSQDPKVRADALRRMRKTETVGDPARYAAQVFSQEGDSSCAVATQVSVLRAHGLLPTTVDPKVQERALVAEAKERHYMKGGTPPEYTGNLLIDRGMLLNKTSKAKWPQLESALRRGSIVQIGVDARVLWGVEAPRPLGHSILATGAEIERNGRRILGVYVNDTGTDPAGAGKFIPIDRFRAAWTGDLAEIR